MKEQEIINEAFSSYRFKSFNENYSDKTINKFLSLYQEMNNFSKYEEDSFRRNKLNNYFESKEDAEIRMIAEAIMYNEKIGDAIKNIAKKVISGAGRLAGSTVRLAGRAKEEFSKGYQAGRGGASAQSKGNTRQETDQKGGSQKPGVVGSSKESPEEQMMGKVGQVKSTLSKIQSTGLANPAAVKDILGNVGFKNAMSDFVNKPLLKQILGGRNPKLLKIAVASYLASIGAKSEGQGLSGGRKQTGGIGNFNLGSD